MNIMDGYIIRSGENAKKNYFVHIAVYHGVPLCAILHGSMYTRNVMYRVDEMLQL